MTEEAKKEVAPEIMELVEKVKEMTVMQLADFVAALEDELGVSAAAPVMMGAMPAAGGGEEEAAEKTSFDVVLNGVGQQKIQVIKMVKEITDLGLKEAKALVDGLPKAVKEGLSKDEADAICAKLTEVGAEAEVK